jgi:hypothetical protein
MTEPELSDAEAEAMDRVRGLHRPALEPRRMSAALAILSAVAGTLMGPFVAELAIGAWRWIAAAGAEPGD